MDLGENAIKVLRSRYLLKDKNGRFLESPAQLFERVAKAIAQAELNYNNTGEAKQMEKQFNMLMHELLFLPNSPTLMNAGTPKGQLSACFVLPVEDTLDSIFGTLKHTALIQQSGGGTGFNFSQLRPKGDYLNSTGGKSSGPVSFMKIYDNTTFYIKQGGKRRGANMGILNIDHPDIEEFITTKRDGESLANFNISVGVPDQFMRAVEQNESWQLKHPGTGEVTGEIPAADLWEMIIENAWATGDPGLIFLDAINRKNPVPGAGEIQCTNPCGEVPLMPYEPCNLGSINLSKMVASPNNGDNYQIDWNKLRETVHLAIRFLDNVLDVNHYIIPEIKNMALANRKIGLGVMGWAEMLIRLNIPYGSREAIKTGRTLMQFINEEAFKASMNLAKSRGTFGNWKKSIYYPQTPIRNATRTSIAPTGTISIIAQTSSSIEPLFALAYKRHRVLQKETLLETNALLEEKLAPYFPNGLPDSILEEGDLTKVEKIPGEIRELFRTALEIPYEQHIQHQVTFQDHTDNAVSKTINMANKATPEDVEHAYKMAWNLGAKGITIFRSGSKKYQVLYKGTKKNPDTCSVCT